VVVSGTWDWSAGTLGAGFALQSTAAATWSTNNSRFLNARTLVLDGPVTWSGGGTLQLQNVATLVNNSTISYTSANIGAFGNVSGPNLVTNAGSFVKTGAGTLSIVTPFNNTGTVDHQIGTITLTGGGTSTGSFDVAAGATLDFLAGTHALNGDVTGAGAVAITGATVTVGAGTTFGLPALIVTSGTGTVNGTLTALDSIRVTGGTLTLQTPAAAITVPRLSLLGGTLQGADSVVVSGTWDWSAGTLGAGFALQSTAAATWSTNNSRFLNARTLVLDGPVTWSGGGTLQLQNVATLVNNSTLSYTSANIGAFGNVSGPNLVTNAGSFVKTGAGTFSIVTPFNNSGVLDVQTGLVGVNNTFSHADGAVIQGAGTLDLANATVSAFSGDVNPGTSPGILTITTPPGGLTQGPASTLNIELDGLAAGTEYDRLNLSGSVTLNGNLVVSRSFTPNLGDRFAILTFANRTGQFASVTLPAVDGLVLDTLWAVDADPVDTLYIVANAATPPGPPGTETAWLGAVSADWNAPQNWFGGNVPDDTTKHVHPGGHAVQPAARHRPDGSGRHAHSRDRGVPHGGRVAERVRRPRGRRHVHRRYRNGHPRRGHRRGERLPSPHRRGRRLHRRGNAAGQRRAAHRGVGLHRPGRSRDESPAQREQGGRDGRLQHGPLRPPAHAERRGHPRGAGQRHVRGRRDGQRADRRHAPPRGRLCPGEHDPLGQLPEQRRASHRAHRHRRAVGEHRRPARTLGVRHAGDRQHRRRDVRDPGHRHRTDDGHRADPGRGVEPACAWTARSPSLRRPRSRRPTSSSAARSASRPRTSRSTPSRSAAPRCRIPCPTRRSSSADRAEPWRDPRP
jgi:hypothetical protein